MSFTQRKLNRLKVWSQYNTLLKKYSRQPIIKNVDVEELKKQFQTHTAPIEEEPKKESLKEKTIKKSEPIKNEEQAPIEEKEVSKPVKVKEEKKAEDVHIAPVANHVEDLNVVEGANETTDTNTASDAETDEELKALSN